MSRIVIIDGHPDPDPHRFVHALANAYRTGALAAGHDVVLIRVCDLEFPLLRRNDDFRTGEPPAEIAHARQVLNRCDHLAIFYPLWLGSMPALLKGFVEQVFRGSVLFAEGARRRPTERLLQGKSARIVITMGMPAMLYRWVFGAYSAKVLKHNVLGFLGIAPIRLQVIGSIAVKSDAQRAKLLDRMRATGAEGR